jgi:hypothetical protein
LPRRKVRQRLRKEIFDRWKLLPHYEPADRPVGRSPLVAADLQRGLLLRQSARDLFDAAADIHPLRQRRCTRHLILED